jgi:glycosyltransferase involved in cell wall biosynthesis
MVVPSFRESFGLIYAEGMSQGLPAIYTIGQGFDGYFKDGEIGYAVNPYDTNDIADKIKKVIDNYDELSQNTLEKVKLFSWNNSVTKLNDIYLKAISSNKA